jgi:hypothetical protein
VHHKTKQFLNELEKNQDQYKRNRIEFRHLGQKIMKLKRELEMAQKKEENKQGQISFQYDEENITPQMSNTITTKQPRHNKTAEKQTTNTQ